MPAFDRVRPLSVVAPILCDAGEPDAAREALEELLEALGPADSRARARPRLPASCTAQAEAAAHESLAAAFDAAGDQARFLLRTEWPQVEPVLWSALDAERLDAESAVQALDAAFPGVARSCP